MKWTQHIVAIGVIGLGLIPRLSAAALIHLKPQGAAATSVIQLGDIAEIRDVDTATATRLAAVTIQPAPAAGRRTQVRVEDVKSRLQALGENLTRMEFSGSAVIQVYGPEIIKTEEEPRFSNQQQSQVQLRIAAFLQKYFDSVDGQNRVAAVGLPADPALVRELLSTNTAYWQIVGQSVSQAGETSLQIQTNHPDNNRTITVTAALEAKPRVLVLRRAVVAGHLIGRNDLAWMAVSELPRQQAVINDPSALIGRQAARALPEGRALSPRDIQRSLLIKRGDTVTVYSRFGAVSIKTVARATSEGAYGDLISLKTLENQKPIMAKVVDFHVAEITPDMTPAESQPGGLKVRFAPKVSRRSPQPASPLIANRPIAGNW